MNKINQFFLFCSGAYTPILKLCPTEINKYVGIGASIFFTALFATMAMFFALNTTFSNYFLISIFSILWGLMIFNLDRYIVSSIKKSSKQIANIMQAIPRLILAVMISLVIAKPLELKVFQEEIADEINRLQKVETTRSLDSISNKLDKSITRLEEREKEIKQNLQTYVDKRNELLIIAQKEADGTGGSRQRNLGPIYQLKESNLRQAQNELNLHKSESFKLLQEIKNKKDRLQKIAEKNKEEIYIPKAEGFAAKLNALSNISNSSSTIGWAVLFINILFVIIECLPIILKLMTSRGPYDQLINRLEEEVIGKRA